jgi:hypothetical protein
LLLLAVQSFTTIKSFSKLELISPNAAGLLAVTKTRSFYQRRDLKTEDSPGKRQSELMHVCYRDILGYLRLVTISKVRATLITE